jgi:hypothetical protein
LSFFSELKRRTVFRAGFAYVVFAWLVAQVLQLVFESFGTPVWEFNHANTAVQMEKGRLTTVADGT